MAENFVRDGRVGDEVWHPCFGNGVIDSRYPEINSVYIVFKHASVIFRDTGMLYYGQAYATLCWGHRIMQQINQGKPPEREDD